MVIQNLPSTLIFLFTVISIYAFGPSQIVYSQEQYSNPTSIGGLVFSSKNIVEIYGGYQFDFDKKHFGYEGLYIAQHLGIKSAETQFGYGWGELNSGPCAFPTGMGVYTSIGYNWLEGWGSRKGTYFGAGTKLFLLIFILDVSVELQQGKYVLPKITAGLGI
jgi:hypothetical protein